ncbi:GTP pyrophosphokinase family protein [Gordonia sp. OPL2]|uniref:GTP pyrophosphokinase n=1 Tax=Gordonia sp. OPL2 TaxID=2486274 RepID=UPI0016558789|nr:RelA/SpoT protein [Gordonia sp. OPL2]
MTTTQVFLKQVADEAIGVGDPSRIDCRSSRIKDPKRAEAKIRRKLRDERITELPCDGDSIEATIAEIVGVKVLCKSTRDLEIFKEELTQSVSTSGYRFAEPPDDYVAAPKPSGYRAYHAVLEIPSTLATKTHLVRVEVQVKTRLQDSWSELTHEDMYKPGEGFKPTGFHRKVARTMADLLSTVDQLADDLAAELETQQDRNTEPTPEEAASADTTVVTVTRSTPRYALAMDQDGQRGLIPARSVKSQLVDSGVIDQDDFIDVSDHIAEGNRLHVERVDNEDGVFYYPVSLPPDARSAGPSLQGKTSAGGHHGPADGIGRSSHRRALVFSTLAQVVHQFCRCGHPGEE